MNWEEWAAVVIGGWFIVSTLAALAAGPLLRRLSRDPDRAWLGPPPCPYAICHHSQPEAPDGEDRGEAPDDAR